VYVQKIAVPAETRLVADMASRGCAVPPPRIPRRCGS